MRDLGDFKAQEIKLHIVPYSPALSNFYLEFLEGKADMEWSLFSWLDI